LSGQIIRTLFNGEQSAGRYTVSWDGANASGDRVVSGLYLVRMEAGKFVAVRKMILAK
jgi:flagellar hook assembly protein FlgD